MTSTGRRVAIVSFILFVAGSPAGAVFFPAIQAPSEKQREKQRLKGYIAGIPEAAKEAALEFIGAMALSFDYNHGTQDQVGKVRLNNQAFSGETELDTYVARPEIVWMNWLSTYGIFGLHRGDNTSDTSTLDLDGWAAGAGVTLSIGLPQYDPAFNKALAIDPLFVVPDFNWTHNEFDDVDGTVDVYNLTTRIGSALRTDRLYWGVYGGPQYQASTEDQTIQVNSFSVDVEVEPKRAWSGVIGSFFGVIFEKGERRPDLLLTLEGGVGNRQGVLLSLRYEHNLFQYFK